MQLQAVEKITRRWAAFAAGFRFEEIGPALTNRFKTYLLWMRSAAVSTGYRNPGHKSPPISSRNRKAKGGSDSVAAKTFATPTPTWPRAWWCQSTASILTTITTPKCIRAVCCADGRCRVPRTIFGIPGQGTVDLGTGQACRSRCGPGTRSTVSETVPQPGGDCLERRPTVRVAGGFSQELF